MLKTILRKLLPLLPISSLALALQALNAWLYPSSELGQNYLQVLSSFFVCELVFMHSSIFWHGRHYLLSGRSRKRRSKEAKKGNPVMEFLFGLFLFLAYGLFVFPMYETNPVLVWNFVILSLFRLVQADEEPWYAQTEFYRSGLDPSARPMLRAMGALFKTFYFALALPMFIATLSLPEFGLSPDVVKDFKVDANDPYGPILLTKTMFVYFSSLFVGDLFGRTFQFLKKTKARGKARLMNLS